MGTLGLGRLGQVTIMPTSALVAIMPTSCVDLLGYCVDSDQINVQLLECRIMASTGYPGDTWSTFKIEMDFALEKKDAAFESNSLGPVSVLNSDLYE
jgi:hypothetical protein